VASLTWLRGHGVDVPALYHLGGLRALSALKSLRGAKILALSSRRLGFIWDYEEVREPIASLVVVRRGHDRLREAFKSASLSGGEALARN